MGNVAPTVLLALLGFVLLLVAYCAYQLRQIALARMAATYAADNVLANCEELTAALKRLEQAMDFVGVANLPRDGFPQHIEASWEDIGEHGRFLTDLGGMSIEMREQLRIEVRNALDAPMPTVPRAGSAFDVLYDLDRRLTDIEERKDDELVLEYRKAG